MKTITATKPDVSLLLPVMVLIFVEEDRWETSLVFDLALIETVGSLKAQIQTATGKPVGMDPTTRRMNTTSYMLNI